MIPSFSGRALRQEVMANLGIKSSRTLDLYVAKGIIPEGRLERPPWGRGGLRRTWSDLDVETARSNLAAAGLPRARRDLLDLGRAKARVRQIERRALRDLAIRVLERAGAAELLEALRPVNDGGPLHGLPPDRQELARAALESTLRRYGPNA